MWRSNEPKSGLKLVQLAAAATAHLNGLKSAQLGRCMQPNLLDCSCPISLADQAMIWVGLHVRREGTAPHFAMC